MKRKLLTYLLMLLSPYFILAQNKTKVYFVEFKGEREITANPIKQYEGKSNNEKPITIRIYSEISFQTMEGIGGAFNEIGGEALMSLPEDQRNEVMKNLFSEDGAGFTFCRTAVGASDFGIDAYSYSEVEGDYKMKKFSIKREKTTLLPYIQMAYKYNPTLKLFASPWSPPGWMKESGFMDGKGDKSKLIDKPEIYQAYALYFSKYIQAYAKEGIQINRLMIQNEQDATTKYPSNYMPPSEMGNFVIDYLRPQFNQDKISTEIWAGTFRTAKKLGVLEFVTNTKWRESVKGIGIQYTTSDQIMNIKTLYPEVQLFHTEGHCHGGENSIKHAFDRFDEIASYVNYGVSNFCYWNMILNETCKSGWGWKQNSLININRENKKVSYNPDYAALALFSKFIRPGMQRIASTFQYHRGKNTMTFIDLEKDITVFLKNESDKPVMYNLKIDDKQSNLVDIPANSMAAVQIRRK